MRPWWGQGGVLVPGAVVVQGKGDAARVNMAGDTIRGAGEPVARSGAPDSTGETPGHGASTAATVEEVRMTRETSRLLLHGGTLIDGAGAPPMSKASVLPEGDRVV